MKRKISILMSENSEERISRIINLVCSRLRKSYDYETCLAKDLSEFEYDRYISIAKNNDALRSALSDQNRRVIIFREKKGTKSNE